MDEHVQGGETKCLRISGKLLQLEACFQAFIGGIELGLERTGYFRTIWQVENDDYCKKILAKHWPKVARFDDIAACKGLSNTDSTGLQKTCPELKTARPSRDNTLPYADLICGGFPCQDISTAGKRAGIEGERSGLWSEMARLVGEIRPRYVLVENVSALLSRGIDRVLGDLSSLGYNAEWDCVPASAVGANHQRDRVFIVAYAQTIRRNEGKQNKSLFSGKGWMGLERCGQDVAHTKRIGSEAGMARQVNGQERITRIFKHSSIERFRNENPWSKDPAEEDPTAKPEMGGMVNGFSKKLDGNWEYTPRVAFKIPERVNRLKTLGNAVVPQVAEYIGWCIKEFDEKT